LFFFLVGVTLAIIFGYGGVHSRIGSIWEPAYNAVDTVYLTAHIHIQSNDLQVSCTAVDGTEVCAASFSLNARIAELRAALPMQNLRPDYLSPEGVRVDQRGLMKDYRAYPTIRTYKGQDTTTTLAAARA